MSLGSVSQIRLQREVDWITVLCVQVATLADFRLAQRSHLVRTMAALPAANPPKWNVNMKRLLAIAAIGAALTLFGTSTKASAADFYGGHGGQHSIGHHGYSNGIGHQNYGHQNYGHQNYGHQNYGHQNYGHQNYAYQNYGNRGYGNGYRSNRAIVPSYGYSSGYAPSYGTHGRTSSYGHGGLHLDIGRFHIGVGGQH